MLDMTEGLEIVGNAEPDGRGVLLAQSIIEEVVQRSTHHHLVLGCDLRHCQLVFYVGRLCHMFSFWMKA